MVRNKSLRWSKIAALTAATTALVVGLGGYPLAKRVWAEHEAQEIRDRYATGLSPCEAPEITVLDQIDSRLRQVVPSVSDVSITAFPSFSEPKGVRIVGTEVVHFRLIPLDREGTRKQDPGDWIRIEIVHKTKLSSSTARSIRDTLDDDVANTHAERPLGFDGVIYYYRTANGRCAMTWSPDPMTRAGRWTTLFRALSEWSRPGGKPLDEAEIRRSIEALEID